ncbi:hypothetical protein SJI19_20920 [Acerihabitans sp. TG2]|nr:hypothetical protein [Acerihabitans sp. TG2]MEA9392966.1 hypothetical protein [Acerihabitans sp. TG2]
MTDFRTPSKEQSHRRQRYPPLIGGKSGLAHAQRRVTSWAAIAWV